MFESAELGQKLDKAAYEAREPALREALLDAQLRVRERAEFSIVVVIAGAEGAGKGETVNLLFEWLDARGMSTHAMGPPTPEEAERPEFFRFWRRLPPRGQIAVFFGSWYTAPIVDRALGRCDAGDFARRLDRIVDFERMLSRENVLLVKLWLHVTKKQQKRAFQKLEKDPDTAWRVTPLDWEYHETYDAFVQASSAALRRTDTAHAPWHVVEAHDKRFRHVTVAERLLAAMEARLAQPPPPPPEPGPLPRPADVNVISSLDLSRALPRESYRRKLRSHQGKLGRLARRMTAAGCSLVAVFEGPDAGGKGGAIRRAVQALDARFYRVIPIAAPTDEEKARPYLWRFWRNVPATGHFTLYDRSWYGRVLVERVEGYCRPEDWQRAYSEINAFEEQLVEAGTHVLKFWLAISPEEQLRRFEDRERRGYKRYKLTPEDWRNREKWDAYEAAACDMIEKTSTELAPWTLVPAVDKHHARIEVLRTFTDALERAVGPDERPGKKRGKHKGG